MLGKDRGYSHDPFPFLGRSNPKQIPYPNLSNKVKTPLQTSHTDRQTDSQTETMSQTSPSQEQRNEHGIARIKADWPCPKIQNIVATVNLDCRLPLSQLSQQARNVEYKPKKFHALIMRIREPRTTTLIFNSGKMVITGAKSVEDARLAGRKHARAIMKCGHRTRFLDFKVQNVVGSVSVGFPIRLEGLCAAHYQFATYEPEIFPGLVYRLANNPVVILVFANGKIVLTGAKSADSMFEAFACIYPLLLDFRLA